MVKAAVIGYGLGGEVFHAPMAQAVGMEISYIMTSNESRAQNAKLRYPNVVITNNYEQILSDNDINLIIISTPNEAHFPLASKALEVGKNVVIDKPLTINSQEADALIAIAKKNGCILASFQNRRFDSDFMTIEKLIKSNRFGKIVRFESNMDRWRPSLKSDAWREEKRPGAGVWYDIGAHLVDQALCLFGFPKSIYGRIVCEREGANVDDAFDVDLEYDGFLVRLGSSCLTLTPRPRFLIEGTEGALIKYGKDLQEDTLKSGIMPTENGVWGAEPFDFWADYTNKEGEVAKVPSENGDYRLIYNNIKEAIDNNEPLLVEAEQSRNVIRVIELALESCASGHKVSFEK